MRRQRTTLQLLEFFPNCLRKRGKYNIIYTGLVKFINNSASLNNGNHDCDSVLDFNNLISLLSP